MGGVLCRYIRRIFFFNQIWRNFDRFWVKFKLDNCQSLRQIGKQIQKIIPIFWRQIVTLEPDCAMSIFDDIEYYISFVSSWRALSPQLTVFLIWRLNSKLPRHILRYVHDFKIVFSMKLRYVRVWIVFNHILRYVQASYKRANEDTAFTPRDGSHFEWEQQVSMVALFWDIDCEIVFIRCKYLKHLIWLMHDRYERLHNSHNALKVRRSPVIAII